VIYRGLSGLTSTLFGAAGIQVLLCFLSVKLGDLNNQAETIAQP
jgi:hypothetical protein